MISYMISYMVYLVYASVLDTLVWVEELHASLCNGLRQLFSITNRIEPVGLSQKLPRTHTVNDLNVAFLNSLHQPLVQVVVYRVQVEVRVVKDLLNESFQFRCVHEPLCGMIKQNFFTL